MNNVSHAGYEHTVADTRRERTELSPELSQYTRTFSSACIVGCGGVGTWVGFFLAANDLTEELRLFDSDSIEKHNHSRFMYPTELTNEYKTIALAALVKQSRPDLRVLTYERDFEPGGDIERLMTEYIVAQSPMKIGGLEVVPLLMAQRKEALHGSYAPSGLRFSNILNMFYQGQYSPRYLPIIDTTDNPEFQQQLCDAVRKIADPLIDRYINMFRRDSTEEINQVPLIPFYTRISYNGSDHITITSRNGSWGMNDAAGRYDVIPSFAMPAILASAYGVYGILQCVQELNLDIYRRIQNVLLPRVRSKNSEDRDNILQYETEVVERPRKTTLPWLHYQSGNTCGRTLHFEKMHGDCRMDEVEILNTHNSVGVIQEKLLSITPSLYPTVAFGASEYEIGLHIDQIEEASDGEKEEE